MLILPGEESGEPTNRAFLQHLFTAVQQPEMQPYNPGFSFEKKMKLVLHHPKTESAATPSALIGHYTELLHQLEESSKEENAEVL